MHTDLAAAVAALRASRVRHPSAPLDRALAAARVEIGENPPAALSAAQIAAIRLAARMGPRPPREGRRA